MNKHHVAAITKTPNQSINIIFGWIADNHWGVVINHHGKLPKKQERNHLGLKFDAVRILSQSKFYYQTN